MLLYEIKKESHWKSIMHIIETLDKLLKNELSATETYQQTLDTHFGPAFGRGN